MTRLYSRIYLLPSCLPSFLPSFLPSLLTFLVISFLFASFILYYRISSFDFVCLNHQIRFLPYDFGNTRKKTVIKKGKKWRPLTRSMDYTSCTHAHTHCLTYLITVHYLTASKLYSSLHYFLSRSLCCFNHTHPLLLAGWCWCLLWRGY